MRLAFLVSLAVAISGTQIAKAKVPSVDKEALSIAELSDNVCYGIVSGAIPMPSVQDPNSVDKSIKALEAKGLSFGINADMMKDLGKPGLTLVSQSTMGSKSLDKGNVILAVGGRLPGCRVILLADPEVSSTEAVSAQLSRFGWRAMPDMTGARGAIEKRTFFRRDAKGDPYLMNLMTITAPAPDSKLRMYTTTIRIPEGVQLPEGL